MASKTLSPTMAYGCIELVGIVSRNAVRPNTVPSLSLSSVGSADVLSMALHIRWIEITSAGFVQVTARGNEAVSVADTRACLQKLLLDYVDAESPAWVQLAHMGRRDVLAQAPKEICQIFVDAGLAYGNTAEIVAFWDLLAARARGVRTAVLVDIGREGERLTLEYEKKRTGHDPKWIALDSNADGYDVLSLVSAEDKRRLTIEVKTSTQPITTGFFHISLNEWQLAQESRFHVFHLWDISGPHPKVATLTTAHMQLHVPKNTGEGTWESVKIPFFVFAEHFVLLSRFEV